jgi:hypothetical protein
MSPKAETTCAEAQARMAEGIDGTLAGPALQELQAHLAACGDCARLHHLGRQGKVWLDVLDDVEPPAVLVHNILAATTFARRETAEAVPRRPGSPSPRAAWVSFFRKPRLVMTAAMAFFSLSMLCRVTGATLDDLQGLRPSVVSRELSLKYHETEADVTRYYENNRLLRGLREGLQTLRDVLTEPAALREESETDG